MAMEAIKQTDKAVEEIRYLTSVDNLSRAKYLVQWWTYELDNEGRAKLSKEARIGICIVRQNMEIIERLERLERRQAWDRAYGVKTKDD